MKKVVYSVTRISKTNSTMKGIGYLTDKDLVIALNSKNNTPYVRVFEDITKYYHPVVNSKNEYKGAYYEIAEVMVTRPDGSKESKEVELNYLVWYKEIQFANTWYAQQHTRRRNNEIYTKDVATVC